MYMENMVHSLYLFLPSNMTFVQVIVYTKHRYQLSTIQWGKYKVLYFMDTEAVLKAK